MRNTDIKSTQEVTFEIAEHLADVKLLNGFVLESDAPKVGREVDSHKAGLQMGFVLAHQVLKRKDLKLHNLFKNLILFNQLMMIILMFQSLEVESLDLDTTI